MRLYFIRESQAARLYSKTNPDDKNREPDLIWIPLSVIEHTTKRGNEHEVKLPDWFLEARRL
jgi:hypothetical protein